jgi:hypothetical protein
MCVFYVECVHNTKSSVNTSTYIRCSCFILHSDKMLHDLKTICNCCTDIGVRSTLTFGNYQRIIVSGHVAAAGGLFNAFAFSQKVMIYEMVV